ncbi:distal long tail fiber assembly catalyst [Proteus phage vB_PmiM_Pm5461]|uniref:Distal long tail fiber assembly catalyst n=1 Tax=Proteus phage vB_PmiM_Pm5461 TaxID=1636250 RepID=A0A0G2SSC9_9CAUD|nr:tail fiber adhesin [Proteus phage vB_PmiM_Pm5461]AKA62103.1 distal long tail fiber assembly catalyst [Proteus phage vB_PmiM_Pm5461]
MAVTGPRVGSSAKKETGESSMKAAGAKLRLSTPFKMSQMIGRSVKGLIYTLDLNTNIDWPKWYSSTKTDVTPYGDFKLGETGDNNMKIIGVGAHHYYNGDKNVYLEMSDPSMIHNYTRLVLRHNGIQYTLVPGMELFKQVFVPRSQDFDAFYNLVVSNLRKEVSMDVIELV